MRNLFTEDRIRALVFAVVLLGILGIFIGGALYVSKAQKLASNLAQQRIEQLQANPQATPDTATAEQGQMLMASDLERRQTLSDQNIGVAIAGGGVVFLALGLLAGDFLLKKRRAADLSTN